MAEPLVVDIRARKTPEPPTPPHDPDPHALAARPGPFLILGTAAEAERAARAWGAAIAVPVVLAPGDALALEEDLVGALAATLRDAVFLRVRELRKVYEGRVVRAKPFPAPDHAGAARTPPAAIDLSLETADDARTLRLEGGFAHAYVASGAREGDIVQIDRHDPIVSVREDRATSEGMVLEERDFVHRVRLGDRDRAPTPQAAPAAGASEAGAPPAPDTVLRLPLYGTGRSATPSAAAMAATDAWVRTRLGGKGTRLEPGILVLTDADALPRRVLAVIREATKAPAAPWIVLHSSEPAALDVWRAAFPDAVRLSP